MKENSLINKLIGVTRSINTYNERKEELVEELKIDLPLEVLRKIVPPEKGDELLYLGYVLNQEQLYKFYQILGIEDEPNFKLNYYVLECHGVYNW
ncbi:MAG: DUF7683 domain-containing protein [Agriterribacter sp.]